MNNPIDTVVESNTKTMPMGATLLKAREQRHLTIDDICTRLRISPRQVKALESDNFAALPEAMITRGFIRNYARLLGIDPEPLLQAYRAYAPSEAPRAFTIQSENILITGKDRGPWLKYIIASVLIAVLLGAWQFYMDYVPKPGAQQAEAVVPTQNADTEEPVNAPELTAGGATTESLPIPALPAAERMPDEAVFAETAPANPVMDSPTTGTQAQILGNTDVTAANPQSSPDAKGMAKLKLSFREKSWVNVTDKNKKIIFDRIMTAGSEELVEGQLPLALVIGNAPASTLVFNDKPVDLAPYTKLNVARITLE